MSVPTIAGANSVTEAPTTLDEYPDPTHFKEISKEQLKNVHSCKVYPSIGFARLGNSEKFYLGPEVPEKYHTGFFRDGDGKLFRQAARFRVFAYNEKGEWLGEIRHAIDASVQVSWTVQVANKKPAWYQFQGRFRADPNNPNLPIDPKNLRNNTIQPTIETDKRSKLINAPDAKTISGYSKSGAEFRFQSNKDLDFSTEDFPDNTCKAPYLGELRTDQSGRLLVLGGHGVSGCTPADEPSIYIHNYANNDYWYDDTSDGPVDCTVTINGKSLSALRGWVLTVPPKYVPSVKPLITLYQVMSEVAQRSFQWQCPFRKQLDILNKVEYNTDVFPLLKVLSQFSWLNKYANTGHGIASGGNFVSQKWQKVLSRPGGQADPNVEIRRSVFARLRKPTLLTPEFLTPKEDALDNLPDEIYGEANTWYMPILAGDDGEIDLIGASPATWLSLSTGMYENMRQWANGNFVNLPHKIDWNSDPHSLNVAALEWCVGGAFAPGIEMSYNVLLAATYSEPFRFATSWTAGDASKYMAIPWQADFFECQAHWWPAQRPDDVITEADFTRIVKLLENKSKLDANGYEEIRKELANSRKAWTRGFRLNSGNDASIKWGDLDMVHFWNNLGLLLPETINLDPDNAIGPRTPFNDSPKLPKTSQSSVEEEASEKSESGNQEVRTNKVEVLVERFRPPLFGTWEAVTEQKLLQAPLQAAMKIELTTVPAYLAAYFSIDDPISLEEDENPEPSALLRRVHDVKVILRKVAGQEMLHLVLAGNVMRAIGLQPVLYDIDFIPDYPTPLPHHAPELILHLLPATASTIESFMDVERPHNLQKTKKNKTLARGNNRAHVGSSGSGKTDGAPGYDTIGEFYRELEQKLIEFANGGKIAFGNISEQFTFLGYRQETGALVTVNNLEEALQALSIIVQQGEGRDESNTDDKELSHYYQFKRAHELIKQDPFEFSNHVQHISGDNTKQVYFKLTEPDAKLDTQDTILLALLNSFNAAYCYILLIIENVYSETNAERKALLISGMFLLMKQILPKLASSLCKIELKDYPGSRACGLYAFYDFKQGAPKAELLSLLKQVDTALNLSPTLCSIATHICEAHLRRTM